MKLPVPPGPDSKATTRAKGACVAVVPARRAERTIRATLESLRIGNADSIERVIVVTSRDDPTAALVTAWAASDPAVVAVLLDSPATAGAARNHGVAMATAMTDTRLVLFVDADCRLEPGGAGRLASELDRHCAAAISARIACEGGAVARVRHMLEFKEAASLRDPPLSWLPPSTTMLCCASEFVATRGFPDLWPGEDLVFSQRLRERGGLVLRSRNVQSVHRHPRGIREMLRHQLRLGRTSAVARRMCRMPGSVFARHASLAPLLLAGRLVRLLRWQAGEGLRAFAMTLVLLPLAFAGLLAWTVAFAMGSRSSRDARREPGPREHAGASALPEASS